MNTEDPKHPAWQEYTAAAEYLAVRGLIGAQGDPLPMNMSKEAVELINEDPEAFQREVQACAYANAMTKVHATFGEAP